MLLSFFIVSSNSESLPTRLGGPRLVGGALLNLDTGMIGGLGPLGEGLCLSPFFPNIPFNFFLKIIATITRTINIINKIINKLFPSFTGLGPQQMPPELQAPE